MASDAELLEIRHMAAPSIASVRDAIAALQAVAYPADATIVLAGDQVRELFMLLTTLAVYADARGRRDVARLARAFLDKTVPPDQRPTGTHRRAVKSAVA